MTEVTKAYRTQDESGSPEAAGTVAWNWIGALAQEQRDAGIAATEIVSEAIEGGGRVTRLYRGTTLLAVATTFRDAMNFTVLTRWLAPELATTRAELATAHALIHQLGENAAKAAGEYAEEVGRLRGALRALENANEALCATRSRTTYFSMIDRDKAGHALDALDEARRLARAALTEPSDG